LWHKKFCVSREGGGKGIQVRRIPAREFKVTRWKRVRGCRRSVVCGNVLIAERSVGHWGGGKKKKQKRGGVNCEE